MRRFGRAGLFSSCLSGAILAAASPAWGQAGPAPTWQPRVEVDAQVGEDIGVSTSLFAPVAQSDTGLVFFDGRLGYDQRYDRNGSATVGARFRVAEDVAIGANAGADFYRSDLGNREQAAVSMGLEGFSSVFDVRVNYRQPLNKSRTISYIDPAATPVGAGALVLENNRLIERYSGFRLEEIPLRGFNGEVGVRLPVGDNASIRGSMGGFDYRDSKADDRLRGYRLGLEMDVQAEDRGTRFTFGGTFQHDDRYGNDARATVRLSVPFGGRARDRGGVPAGLDRQMGDRVRRDYVARSGSRYTDLTNDRFAVDARTGSAFGGFYYANGTGSSGAAGTITAPTTLADATTRAGANGVVVALGNGGDIATSGVTLASGQYLVGGASALDVRLINGQTVSYGLGGTNGTVVGTAAGAPAVSLGQGSIIRDILVRGAGVGIAANGVGGFALDRVVIENTGGAGLSLNNTLGTVALGGLTIRGGTGPGVLVNGGSSISLANSAISGGAGAIDIDDGGTNLAVSLSNLTLAATGGNVLDIDGSGTGTVTVTGMSGITVRGDNGESGGISVRSATFDANATTAGIQTVNAGRAEIGTSTARVAGEGLFLTDVTGSLSFADLDIANRDATGLRVVNAKTNDFTLATLDGTIDTLGGTAADLDPLAIDLNFARVVSAGAAGAGLILDTVVGGRTGHALTIGTLGISNSGGDGLVLLNSTGLVRINGGTISNADGSAVRIGTAGVAGSGGSIDLAFGGSITDTVGAVPIVGLYQLGGTTSFTGAIEGAGTGGIVVQDLLASGSINFGAVSLDQTSGTAIDLDRLAGAVRFAGPLTIAGPTADAIVIGNVPGGVTFGDVDISGLGAFAGLDVRGAQGTILFNTLDISGNGTGTGIDLTGSTNSGNLIVLNGSVIQNVDIGVNLTDAAMTGQFRFGDGDGGTLDSRIAANTPIVIAGLNTGQGSYNFADVALQGDISNISGGAVSAYYAQVGATGAGTRDDPGSLTGAQASGAQYIVLLNDVAGGQDIFDAASVGGSFNLTAGQSLISFLTRDFFAVSGAGVPANLVVTGIGPAGISNPYAGSGGAVLTSSLAGSATINLASNAAIDGLLVRNDAGGIAVVGSGVTNVRIQNSDISGAAGAIAIDDGGIAGSVQLTNLDLSSGSGVTLALSGAGAGTLGVSASNVDIAASGTSTALSIDTVESAGIDLGTVTADVSATTAVSMQGVSGGSIGIGGITLAGTTAGEGVSIGGTSSAVTIQSIGVGGSEGDAVRLFDNSGPISIGTIQASAVGNGVQLTRNGAVSIDTLVINGGNTGLAITDGLGDVTIGTANIGDVGVGLVLNGVGAGTGVSIGDLGIDGTAAAGIEIAGIEGSVDFTGATDIAGVGTSGIVLGGGGTGTIRFADVDITGLTAGTSGVHARAAAGTISFGTLNIAGLSTSGTRGIDLTGATFATGFEVANSSVISGVGTGVDLTSAAITGSFRFGDGSSSDANGAASTIDAVVPIEVAGLNAGVGSYDFADVNLVGDISKLVSTVSVYHVLAGATGAGTLSDPGSLAGAELSGAQVIVLLNDGAGGQDVLDGVGAGGSFDMAAGQSLFGFLNGDTLTLPGGSPANLRLFGITPGRIVNPFTGSGAPILTTSVVGANTVVLGGSNTIDGVVIQTGAAGGAGVFGGGVANITVRDSIISGQGGAIRLIDNGAAASIALSNLRLASSGGRIVSLDGGGGGTLTVTALDRITMEGGNGETGGFNAVDVRFDADLTTAGIQTVVGSLSAGSASARLEGVGLRVLGDGSLDFTSLDVVNSNSFGVDLWSLGGLSAVVRSGSLDTIDADALVVRDAAVSINLSNVTGDGGGIAMSGTRAAIAGQPVLNVDTLTIDRGTLSISGTGNYVVANASITNLDGPAVMLGGRANLDYAGDITTGASATITLDIAGHSGTATFRDGTITATGGGRLRFDNADGTYRFLGAANLAAGIIIENGSSGSFDFANSAIVTSVGPALEVRDSTASVRYSGTITAAGVGPAIDVVNHSAGTIAFGAGSIDARGFSFVNADGTYTFDAGIDIDASATGISIGGGSSGTFDFANSAIIASAGSALEVRDSTASVRYSGTITATGATSAIDIVNHSAGTISFGTGSLDANGGTGLSFVNADGTYTFDNGIDIDASVTGISIGGGSSGSFRFGAGTSVRTSGGIAIDVANSTASIDYRGAVTAAGGTGLRVADHSLGTIDFTAATLDLSSGAAAGFDNADGTYGFGNFRTTGGAGIAIRNGSAGTFTFGDVDIVGIGTGQTAIDLTGANGNVTFQTLDISGSGGTGIDLTGSTSAAAILVRGSSSITGVRTGVDLTNAAITGSFQYGDGERTTNVTSAINATIPIAITGLNGGTGSYNFADVTLIGDTSALSTSARVFYVLAGASGAGTLSDPGSLAAAEAATADFIILLNNPNGGQDVITAAGSNGNSTLLLDANQALRSFRDSNVIALPGGGAPANLILTGLTSGQVTNPFANAALTAIERAPILTTIGAADTVTLSNGSSIDGVFIQGVAGQSAIYGIGRSGVAISNATLSGAGVGLRLDGGVGASATLDNLDITSSNGGAWLNLARSGSLTLTGSGIDIASSGPGALLALDQATIGAGGLSFGTLTGTGSAISITQTGGSGTLAVDTIALSGTAIGTGVALTDNSADIELGAVTVSDRTGAAMVLSGAGNVAIDSLIVRDSGRGLNLVDGGAGIFSIGSLDIDNVDIGLVRTGTFTGALTIGTATVSNADTAMLLGGSGGTVAFTGDVSILNPVVAGIEFAGGGGYSFDDVDITGLAANGRGVDARSMGGGNINFATLDITGASATGTRGIDLTGNTAGGAFIVGESSAITGVGIGVDLTNASRTGAFRFGDGRNDDGDLAASRITATTPIVIAGLNGTTGTYDFRDVTLTGDTGPLEVSAFFVRQGATGAGSASNPGSLAAAALSGASYIVLLNDNAGGTAETINGTLTLADGQSLLAFRNVNSFNVGGGAPSNVLLFGVTTGNIVNPFTGSGAPILTSTNATGTVLLGGNNLIDGAIIANTGIGAGVFANGTAGIATIRNSTISGGGAGIDIRSGTATRIVNLQNLTLRNAGNNAGALLTLNGTGGSLTVTGMSNFNINTSGGETAGLIFNTVTFDSDLAAAGIQAVNAGAFTIGTSGARVQGDGLSLTNVSGALTFTDIDIANNGGTGLLVANSKANNFLLTTLDGSVDTTNGTAVNLDPLVVNMMLADVTASGGAYGVLLDQVEGSFTVNGAVNVTGATTAGIGVRENNAQSVPLTAAFNGAVTINNTTGAGLSFVNNSGATISFAGGGSGVDVTTTSGSALVASGGGTINFTGSGNSLASSGGTPIALDGVTLGSGGFNFASVTANGAVSGMVISSVAGTGALNLGTVNLQGITSRGLDVNTLLGAALSITDLDIGLNNAAAVGLDLSGATLAASISIGDFDVTNAAAPGSSIGVDLRGVAGGQAVHLGGGALGAGASTISGVGTGIYLNAASDAAFRFGDDGPTPDGTSTIAAATAINAAAAPVTGSYDFADVAFSTNLGLGFGLGRVLFIDADGATGGGNGSGSDAANPMTLAAAELALATDDLLVLVNNGSAISAAGSNGDNALQLLAGNQVRGFGQGLITVTVSAPPTIRLASNTISIADPTGNGAATVTSGPGADVIRLGASGNRISGFILDGAPGGALRGIVDNGGATGTVVNFMTVRNFNAVGGYGVEITPSTNSIIDNASFAGNTNDIFLNAAGSTISNVTAIGATGTSITLNNTTGATALTNVNISGAATALSFTTPAGTINATNVDIRGAGTSALTVSGGTASFNFDAASSIIQAAGGAAVNFTGNHTTGTFAFAGLINATNGNGLQFNNSDGTYNFTGTTTLNGGDAGIDIYNGATGSFSFGAGTSVTHNGVGNALSLLSSANLTFNGTITDNDGTAVDIDSHDAGTATFNGAISSSLANAGTVIAVNASNAGTITFNGQMNIASTGTVVRLSNNDGGTINFNAAGTGLDITGGTGTGMEITGGGTVNVLGSGNSIATTSGTLLDITNSGATATTANLTFATLANTGGANGIVVNRTAGTLGGSVAISGGAITAATRGVSMSGDALSLSYGGTITTSGGAARVFEATSRTGGTVTLSGNLTDTSQGINIANNTGGAITFSGQSISLNTGSNNALTLANNSGATVNFASAAGGNGFDIVTGSGIGLNASGGGTLTITGSGNSIQTATGQILSLSGVSAGASGINFGSLQNTGTVTGIAVNFNNFDNIGGGAFSGGTTSIAATTGGDGIFVGNGSNANIGFGATTIGTTAGTIGGDGIEVNGTGNGSVTFASVDIDGTTAHGVNITGAAGATGAVSINGGTIGATASSGGDGVNLTGGGTGVTIAAAITKTNAGNIVEVSNRAAGTATFSGNLSATGGFANGILLNNNNGGTITFSGASKVIGTGTNNAIQFDNTNVTGAAVSFTGGGLAVTTGNGRGITATSTTAGAGSLAITGTANSITSVGGFALNLVNTNIAASGVNFQSISANGGVRGILLNNTGAAGGLRITGTGTTDGSGGTIQNITERGIELRSTALVSIANVNLTNASTTGQAAGLDNDLLTANGAIFMNSVATAVFNNVDITGTIADNGITGINVSNFQFNNGLIDNAGDGANESGIEFINLSGTSSLTNTEIRFSETNSLDIYNTDVNLNLTLNNVIFRDTQSSATNGEGGLQFRSFSSAAGAPLTNIDIIDSDFLRLRSQAIQVIGEDDSIVNVDITNNVIDVGTGIGSGIDINGNDTATVNFNIIGNPTIRTSGGAAINISAFQNANVMGRISNNANIAVFSQSGTSNASGAGVRLLAQESSRLIAEVSGNAINQGAFNNSASVDVIAREGSARLDLRLLNNVIDSTDTNTLADINMQSGSSSGSNIETNQIYAFIANNNLTAAASPVVLRLRVSELDNTHDPRIFLQGFVEGGAGLDDDAVATWNANGNTPGANTGNITVSLSGTATAPSAGNAVAPSNPLP